MDVLQIITMAVLGAAIGYSTNWIAIKMLFRPRGEIRVFGLRLPFTPGLIPKERERISKKIAETVGTHLLPADLIRNEIFSEKTAEKIAALLDGAIKRAGESDATIGEIAGRYWSASPHMEMRDLVRDCLPAAVEFIRKLPDENPEIDAKLTKLVRNVIDENLGRIAGIFINSDRVYNNIKEGIFTFLTDGENYGIITEKADEFIGRSAESLASVRIADIAARLDPERAGRLKESLTGFIARALEQAAQYIADDLDVAAMVEGKMNEFGVDEVEEIILSVVKKELNVIMALGGLLGGVIGLAAAFIGG